MVAFMDHATPNLPSRDCECPQQPGMLIAPHLDPDARLASTRERLRAELEIAEVREQFIVVLGHDLRNPWRRWTPERADC